MKNNRKQNVENKSMSMHHTEINSPLIVDAEGLNRCMSPMIQQLQIANEYHKPTFSEK